MHDSESVTLTSQQLPRDMITTNFTKLLEIDVPIVVAPMIGFTGGCLAGAAACSGYEEILHNSFVC